MSKKVEKSDVFLIYDRVGNNIIRSTPQKAQLHICTYNMEKELGGSLFICGLWRSYKLFLSRVLDPYRGAFHLLKFFQNMKSAAQQIFN
jgi:hypothetical protein